MPWSNRHIPKEVGSASWGVIEELGDHPWINALGWDVLFSVLGLCGWSIISSANVRDMLQCTLMPWLDDIEEAMEDTVEEVQHVIEEVASRASSVAQNVQETAGEYTDQVKQVAAPAVRKINDKAKDLRDTALPVFSQISPGALDNVVLRDNILGPMLQAMSPYNRRYGTVLTTINTGKVHTYSSKTRTTKTTGGFGYEPLTNATHSHEASGRRPAQEGLRRGRSAGLSGGLKGGNASPAERRPSSSSTTASEVLINAAADAEAAGVTWALFVIGGLGMASAGVYGADQI